MAPQLSPELEQFFAVTAPEFELALRKVIAAPADGAIPNLDEGLAYSLGLDSDAAERGKRLRPLLCLLVSDALCGSHAAAMPFALGIELMHNFALVHDDIEDGDEFRRGRPAVWIEYGLGHGINIGDYLFTKIFTALLSGGDAVPAPKALRFFELMGSTLDHTHRGQALDMNARGASITVEHYMRLVREKTGYYLAAPLVAGAIAADAPVSVEDAFRKYGLFIGPLFQIRDDVIDLTSAKGREAIGSDICEGKRSFLVAWVCEHGTQEQCGELLTILDLPREDTTPEMINRAISIFRECGAFDEAERMCGELKASALESVQSLPEPLRAHMCLITEYLAGRAK